MISCNNLLFLVCDWSVLCTFYVFYDFLVFIHFCLYFIGLSYEWNMFLAPSKKCTFLVHFISPCFNVYYSTLYYRTENTSHYAMCAFSKSIQSFCYKLQSSASKNYFGGIFILTSIACPWLHSSFNNWKCNGNDQCCFWLQLSFSSSWFPYATVADHNTLPPMWAFFFKPEC